MSTIEEIRTYYNKIAGIYDERAETNPHITISDHATWSWITGHLPKNRESTILDAGGGTGKWAIRIARLGYRVMILDISAEMLRVASKKAREEGRITQNAQAPYMREYGNMSAASFLLVGMMCNFFLQQSQSMPQGIANPGAMEMILLTPCSIPTFILGTMSWGYFWNSINIAVFVLIGILFFGMDLSAINWLTFVVILFLGVMAMWGLGIIAAGIQLVTKRWDPITWFLMTFSFFVSGVFYSPEALLNVDASGLLYSIAWCLPHTYVYHMARLSFIGESLFDIMPALVKLFILTGIIFSIGWLTFKLCLRRCQLEDSLGWV